MNNSVKHVAITGAAGQIAYALLFRVAHGDLLGADQPIVLHLLELPGMMPVLEGVRMELEDCAFPLLRGIHIGSDPYEVFEGIDYALLVGSKPRSPGMERVELLKDNAKIFVEQGKALDKTASSSVKVLVVGNPCNTNCLLAMQQATRIPKRNFYAMMRLDQNRATALLAKKADVSISDVTHMTIWGNHSVTQVPDFVHARIQGRPCPEVITDHTWLEESFISSVQKRGGAVLAARGKSSAASAANAAIEAMRAMIYPTAPNEWFSAAVTSDSNPYGIAGSLVFSFPCRVKKDGEWEIVPGLSWNSFLQEKIKITEKELLDERGLVGI